MKHAEERGILDLWALRLRVATIAAGVWLTYVLCSAGELYVAATWQRSHRPALAILFGAALCSAFVLSLLPREPIVRSRYREAFFLTWSILDVVLIAIGALADGGTASPIALFFIVPVVFATLSYPLGSVAAVGGLTVAAYLMLAVTVGGSDWSHQALFAVVLTCAGAMSAWQSQYHNRQRQALREVSRTDPLTGCLNRRGFEERAVAEIDAATRRCSQGAVLVLDIDHFKPVNDRLGHAAGDELLCWVVQTLKQLLRPGDEVGRLGGDEFAVLFAEIEPSDAVECAARIAQALGERAPCSLGLATFPIDATELEELIRQADARLYASRTDRPQPGPEPPAERLSWAAALAHAVDMRMDSSHEHSRAVADLAVSIATSLGWREERLGMLRVAAMLHDVGKVSVPDGILRKPGPLSASEWAAIREHPGNGAELVARIDGLEMIVPWIRHSHESYDGSGYPDGLRGEEIPQASRILRVADAFDAITSKRSYGDGDSIAGACAELRGHSGTDFDPACVEALLQFQDATAPARQTAAARSSA